MKRKGLIGRLAVVAVVLSLITMSLTAGTLAKYASETSGTATATVAKWAIKFTDGGATEYTDTNKIALNLKDTQKVTDKLVADERIAPGTTGSFAMAVDGTGTEVAFTYTIELDMSSLTGVPLAFYDGDPDNGGSKITLSSNKITLTGNVMADGTGTAASETIYWKWDSTGIGTGTEDERDTALGETAATFEIPVTIKAEQMLTKPVAP